MKSLLPPLFTCVLIAALAVSAASGSIAAEARKSFVYVGTYTDAGSKGIYRLHRDPQSGALAGLTLVAESANPSFLAAHPSGRFLYAVNEDGKETDSVSAFAVDPASGELRFLNKQPAQGGAPCHLLVDAGGRFVIVANYVGGNVAVLPIAADGKIEPATTVVKHEGHGANKARQEASHAHAVVFDPKGQFLFVSDLGIDKIMAYRFDSGNGKLTPWKEGTVALPPGSGPRHFAFAPDGRHAYSLEELSSTVTVFDYDAGKGALTTRQTISTLPSDFKGESSTAEIVVRPDGRFVYASNRGHDSIAIYAVDGKSGKLTLAGHQSTLGKTPRNFTVDPSGTFLYAANQASDTAVAFRIDAKNGGLTPVGEPLSVPRPVCLLVR